MGMTLEIWPGNGLVCTLSWHTKRSLQHSRSDFRCQNEHQTISVQPWTWQKRSPMTSHDAEEKTPNGMSEVFQCLVMKIRKPTSIYNNFTSFTWYVCVLWQGALKILYPKIPSFFPASKWRHFKDIPLSNTPILWIPGDVLFQWWLHITFVTFVTFPFSWPKSLWPSPKRGIHRGVPQKVGHLP